NADISDYLSVGVDDLAFRAYRSAYLRLAYQIISLSLDLRLEVSLPVITLCALAYRSLGNTLGCSDLPDGQKASPVIRFDTFPVWRLLFRLRHNESLFIVETQSNAALAD